MSLFEPTSIAVIGASATEGKVGHDVLQNLLLQGYAGAVFPVNPKGGEILGKKVYATVSEVPEEVDLAIIIIPAIFVPDAMRDCGVKGVKGVVIITAGFSEVHTDEGKRLEEEVIAIAAEHNIALIGPNCLGILRPSIGMNASFAKGLPQEGNVALISQSGAMAVAIMDASPAMHIGYSLIASIGNKAQMDECDFLELCEKDEKTTVIGFYLESILDGERFQEVATRVAKKKHVVLLKSGVSEQGKKAASSHTGALAGNDAAIDAVCAHAGLHRAHTSTEFLDLIATLSTQPKLLSHNVAVITNAGGPGILATDAAEKFGLELPEFTESTLQKLRPELPAAAGLVNPIDVIGDAGTDRYRAALEACGTDKNIYGICVLLTPQVMTPCKEIAEAIVEWKNAFPLMPIVTSFMGAESIQEARGVLQKGNIPTFESPERAIRALASLLPKADYECTGKKETVTLERPHKAAKLLEGKEGLLSEEDTKELFTLYDITLPSSAVASSKEKAVTMANEIGYPVILKISSPQIVHKTDVGGIIPNLRNDAEVEKAFEKIMDNCSTQSPDAVLKGVLVQQFLPVGNEFIVGAVRDSAFGPLTMVGLGGIYTELFKDTCFRLAPVTESESYEMLRTLKSWKLLMGARGSEQSDIAALAELLRSVSEMVAECPQISELDINPVLVGKDRIVVADAKVILQH